jgi:hypothetical protein
MQDRIDSYLDGTVERAALTPDERAHVALIERVAEEARAFVTARPAPNLTDAVMRRVRSATPRAQLTPRTLVERLAARLWAVQQISFAFRPAYGIAALCVLLLIAALALDNPRTPSALAPFAMTAAAPRMLVQFRLLSTDASSVRLAGSFSDWKPEYVLRETVPGVWTVTLPLPVGVHDYAFVVDGERWVTDPFAPQVEDGFGGINSRLSLLPPEDAPRS